MIISYDILFCTESVDNKIVGVIAKARFLALSA